MKKRKQKSVTPESIEQVYDVLDKALSRFGLLPPVKEDNEYFSELEIETANIQLPAGISDPQLMLEQGRKILKDGFSVQLAENNYSEAFVELAQAARNGKEISEDILNQMHKDRAAAELQSKKP